MNEEEDLIKKFWSEEELTPKETFDCMLKFGMMRTFISKQTIKDLSISDLVSLRNYATQQQPLNEEYYLTVRYGAAEELDKRIAKLFPI